jgi:hypothetical protein
MPERCAPLGHAPGLAYKHHTRLERPVLDKHSSLFGWPIHKLWPE